MEVSSNPVTVVYGLGSSHTTLSDTAEHEDLRVPRHLTTHKVLECLGSCPEVVRVQIG